MTILLGLVDAIQEDQRMSSSTPARTSKPRFDSIPKRLTFDEEIEPLEEQILQKGQLETFDRELAPSEALLPVPTPSTNRSLSSDLTHSTSTREESPRVIRSNSLEVQKGHTSDGAAEATRITPAAEFATADLEKPVQRSHTTGTPLKTARDSDERQSNKSIRPELKGNGRRQLASESPTSPRKLVKNLSYEADSVVRHSSVPTELNSARKRQHSRSFSDNSEDATEEFPEKKKKTKASTPSKKSSAAKVFI